MKTYHKYTASLTYSFIACLPLLALYELLIFISQPDSEAMVRLSADIWIRSLLLLFGENTLLLTLALTLVLGGVIFYLERNKKYTLKQSYFLGMVAESVIWALLLWMLVSQLVGVMFGMAAVSADGELFGMHTLLAADATGPGSITRLQMLALSIGAGLYEELIFRVVLVYSLLWFFSKFMSRNGAFAAAILLGAALFSLVHYVGTFGDPFTLPSFMFRMLFGLALNGLLLFRGFGITAWTHSMYDVILVMFFWQG
ncbi:MAG: CPBP family intramembrane metalloprotease [Balneolales bacterium]|nr:CPBP family intramembrane metalloprotease [Balneolales bacterium]